MKDYVDAQEKEQVKSFQYVVGQFERGGETDKLHYQGYVVFEKRKRFGQVQDWVKAYTGVAAHIEARRGSHVQAREYCMKEDTRAAETWSGPHQYGECNFLYIEWDEETWDSTTYEHTVWHSPTAFKRSLGYYVPSAVTRLYMRELDRKRQQLLKEFDEAIVEDMKAESAAKKARRVE